MNKERYYFPELTEQNALFYAAELSKQVFNDGENILEILQKNYNILYEQSPRKISYLMEENNRSIFDLSPNNSEVGKKLKENISPTRKTGEVLSTPTHRIIRLPRKYLSVDAAEKEFSETEAAEIIQKRTFSNKVSMSKPCVDINATTDKIFVTPKVSKSPKTTDSPGAENKESPRSAETVAMLINLNVDEDKASRLTEANKISDVSTPNSHISNSPHQVVDISSPNSQISNSPQQICGISPNSQISVSPHQIAGILQDCVGIGEEIKTSNLIANIKHTESPIKRSRKSSHNDTDIQIVVNSTEKAEMNAQDTRIESFSVKGNKMNSSPAECHKILVTTEVKRKYPSPRSSKFTKIIPRIICSDEGNELDIEFPWESVESPSPTSRNSSPRDYKHDQNLNTSKEERSLNESTIKTSPKIFEPQISPCEKRTCNDSFQNSQSGCITLKSISPSAIHSRESSSSKFIEHQISPLKCTTGLHNNLVTTISPGADKEHRQTSSTGISPSSRPSSPKVSSKKMESKISPSEKKEYFYQYASKKNRYHHLSPPVSSKEVEAPGGHCSINMNLKPLENSDYNVINYFIYKLNKLHSFGDECMKDIFEKITEFQKELHFLFLYVKKIAHVVEKIIREGNECVTEDCISVTSELAARASKLAENLNLWKSAGDLEIQTWIKCFEEIKNIKNVFETSLNSESSPVNCLRVLRTYEKNLKSIWKEMIHLKNLEDSRRSLLLKASFDFETLIKKFVKCLIIVGIVKSRTEAVST